jgi:uncharacterized membrane protein YedE/YeeE
MEFINSLSEQTPEKFYLYVSLFIGFLYGFIAQREQFCFSGGIKDFILFKQTKRTASLIVAILTAILVTQYLSHKFEIDFLDTRYYSNVNYLLIVLGGALFGYGMMISDGCSSRHLIKMAQRDTDSIFVLLSLGVFSFLTYTLLAQYNDVIHQNTFVEYFQKDSSFPISIYLIVAILVFFLYKNIGSIKNLLQTWDGLLIGFIVSFGWIVTYYFINEMFLDETLQSLSFVYPIGKTIEYAYSKMSTNLVAFPILVMFGVIAGAFISSLFNSKYSKKQMCDTSNQNPPKLWLKMFGGACMGIGGILAIGCTVGQGLSGLSTLSFASLIAITSIYISAYITAYFMHKNNSLIACFYFDFKK